MAESKEYTKTTLMRMSKPDIFAVANEIGVDLSVLPKLTKDSIADAIIVFLEPYVEMSPVAEDHELEEVEETTEPRVSEPESATVEVEEVKRQIPAQFAIVETAIKSQWPGRLVVSNNPSGKEYIWEKPGDTIMVANEDVNHVMSRNRSEARGCCGSTGGHIYFVLA